MYLRLLIIPFLFQSFSVFSKDKIKLKKQEFIYYSISKKFSTPSLNLGKLPANTLDDSFSNQKQKELFATKIKKEWQNKSLFVLNSENVSVPLTIKEVKYNCELNENGFTEFCDFHLLFNELIKENSLFFYQSKIKPLFKKVELSQNKDFSFYLEYVKNPKKMENINIPMPGVLSSSEKSFRYLHFNNVSNPDQANLKFSIGLNPNAYRRQTTLNYHFPKPSIKKMETLAILSTGNFYKDRCDEINFFFLQNDLVLIWGKGRVANIQIDGKIELNENEYYLLGYDQFLGNIPQWDKNKKILIQIKDKNIEFLYPYEIQYSSEMI